MLMFSILLRVAASIVNRFPVSVSINIAIGGVGESPLKAVTGAIFPWDGEGAWLRVLWTIGSKSDQLEGESCSSQISARAIRNNSSAKRSTAPLDQGKHGTVKWW